MWLTWNISTVWINKRPRCWPYYLFRSHRGVPLVNSPPLIAATLTLRVVYVTEWGRIQNSSGTHRIGRHLVSYDSYDTRCLRTFRSSFWRGLVSFKFIITWWQLSSWEWAPITLLLTRSLPEEQKSRRCEANKKSRQRIGYIILVWGRSHKFSKTIRSWKQLFLKLVPCFGGIYIFYYCSLASLQRIDPSQNLVSCVRSAMLFDMVAFAENRAGYLTFIQLWNMKVVWYNKES